MKSENKKSKSAGKNILSFIGVLLCIVFGFMLICNIVIIVKGTLHPEMPPSVLGTTPMVVLSGSMSGEREGHVEVGDLIFIGKIQPEELEEGDVIAFMDGKIFVTHRITKISKDENGRLLFTTKGDANNAEDQNPVTEERLVGILKGRIPKVGDFAMFLQTPLGMVLFIGIPLIGFIIYDIIRSRRYSQKEKQKQEELEAELERLKKLAGEKEENAAPK